MTAVRISVVICTYNPDGRIFKQCLDAVTSAALIYTPHEILIVDNNSTEEVAEKDYVRNFLEKNSRSRVIREVTQGLTPARLRSIRETSGDLIIFVDDDNFIDADYFEAAAEIVTRCPFIGAFSGRVSLEYDTTPEAWTKKYWGMLIYRQFDKDLWSNMQFNNDTMPNGAGLCVTRDTAGHYLKLFDDGKRNFNLDRSKESLMSGGDNDLAMCACDIGKGMGLFKALHLRHFIPARRFTPAYLSRLAYGIYYSYAMLLHMRTGRVDKETFAQRIKHLIRITVMNSHDRMIQRSCKRGLREATELIQSHAAIIK
jgi:glycosyltransferase involved in cell wall biosynthesis